MPSNQRCWLLSCALITSWTVPLHRPTGLSPRLPQSVFKELGPREDARISASMFKKWFLPCMVPLQQAFMDGASLCAAHGGYCKGLLYQHIDFLCWTSWPPSWVFLCSSLFTKNISGFSGYFQSHSLSVTKSPNSFRLCFKKHYYYYYYYCIICPQRLAEWWWKCPHLFFWESLPLWDALFILGRGASYPNESGNVPSCVCGTIAQLWQPFVDLVTFWDMLLEWNCKWACIFY